MDLKDNQPHDETKGAISEESKDSKASPKEKIEKMVDSCKPYAQKAWTITKDLTITTADFIKEKTPGIIEATKKGLCGAKEAAQEFYQKYQKQKSTSLSDAEVPNKDNIVNIDTKKNSESGTDNPPEKNSSKNNS